MPMIKQKTGVDPDADRETSIHPSLSGVRGMLKRGGDIVLSLLIGFVMFLPGVIIAFLIKLTSDGPVFFTHTRIGRGGVPFEMWKFRTMCADSHALLLAHFEGQPGALKEWEEGRKLRNDPRVTRLGRWLRRSSLDELPQLWNVLRGDMSLVGPRPIVAEEAGHYGDAFVLYTQVRPGLSGLWQISGRNHIPFPERVRLDSDYVNHWGILKDFQILLLTLKAVFTGEGAY